MTVGDLRGLISQLPDDASIRPQWRPGYEPDDDAPGVVLYGFDVTGGELMARVGLFYLEQISEEDE